MVAVCKPLPLVTTLTTGLTRKGETMTEKIVATIVVLILLYLIVNNSNQFNSVLKSVGNAYEQGALALQGR